MPIVRRVLIAGGGIGGLAMAAALGKVGIHADLYEQGAELREVGAGVGLWSNALASLDQLGAGDDVRAATVPVRIFSAAAADGRVLTSIRLDDLGAEFADASCRVVARPVLLAALARQVAPDRVHASHRVEAAESSGSAVHVRFHTGWAEEGDLLIGADGLHSVVRSMIAGQDRIRYSGQTCFRGLATLPSANPREIREIYGAGQRASVCPIDGRRVYWWVAHNAPVNEIVPPALRKAMLLERYRGWPFGLPDAIAATEEGGILQNDVVDRKPGRRYARGRVVLIGDAAHPTTPNLGQGANMAIDDALVLARALRDEESVADALARYERERLDRTRLIVKRSWAFGRPFRWRSRPAIKLREAILRRTPARTLTDLLRWQILENVGPLGPSS
ncbi:MAG TPA: FAD-dependent monooxygenase [Polyangia bacterium]|nr:FAD-dependent monooxygenase [Polyangia bacterium]